jgi:hypothetical protein
MSYEYEKEKPGIFTENGQVMFLRIRDKVQSLLKQAGAFSMFSAMSDCTGESWQMMACVDRLVELGEIKEVPRGNDCPGQYRIFVRTDE